MAMATVLSRAQLGMDAPLVRVEIDLAPGLPRFAIEYLKEFSVLFKLDSFTIESIIRSACHRGTSLLTPWVLQFAVCSS